MNVLEQLRSKYKMSAETEIFLKSRIEELADNEPSEKEKVDQEKFHAMNEGFDGKIASDFDGTVREFSVPSAGVPCGISIDVMKPKECARRPGILINFHGGGNANGSRKTTQSMCMLLARELKCIVANVEYRLAPEHKFPAMFDDGKAVVRWILMNKSLIGGENESKVGVIGSGGGGGIAATCAFEVPGVDYQILVYPLVDWRCEGPSFDEFEFKDCSINMSDMVRKGVEKSISSEKDKKNPRASPLLRSDFSSLPPTLLFIAEIDPYRDSNYELKSKLKAANVECESKIMRGAIHGFFALPGLFQETNQRTREIIAQFYKKHGVS